MTWKNAGRDKLPKDGQKVLISLEGVNHLAVYDRSGNCFVLSQKGKRLDNAERLIYWAEYDPNK